MTAIEMVLFGENHQAIFKVKVLALDKADLWQAIGAQTVSILLWNGLYGRQQSAPAYFAWIIGLAAKGLSTALAGLH